MSNQENPKIIAFYLPQFHTIPENDEWWGTGFTEWTNTKKAIPLFKGHQQPKTPDNNNFYNLLDPGVQVWQANLAKEHGIYGFCYYHYWFNGKQLLEKPMENMLQNKDVDIPFCISWANEPWARTWDGKDTEVLMPQKYGGKQEWKNHFNYLLQFFRDERYICIEGKPLIVIYRVNNIPNFDEMIEFWEELAIENNFSGIYLVETLNSFQKDSHTKKSSAVIEFEPMFTLRHDINLVQKAKRYFSKKTGKLEIFDYDKIWKKIIERDNIYSNKQKITGAFVSWDNTARKGKKGIVFKNASPKKFGENLEIQYKKAKNENQQFIFINAWNEWAEGTYLEPDTVNKNNFLSEIRRIVIGKKNG